MIPIVTVYNNEETMSDLERIESLVNDYDKVLSDVSNEFEAFRNAYLMLKNMIVGSEDAERLREQGIIEVMENGDAKFITKQIQTEALENHLNRLERNIYKFSQVPDLSDESFAGNLSGVAIRFKLFGLETKCIVKERKMERAIRDLFRVIVAPLRVITGKEPDALNLALTFTRNIPNNITELVDTVTKLDGKVDKETLLALLPFIDNPKEVLEKLKADIEESRKNSDPYSPANVLADEANLFPNLNAQNAPQGGFNGAGSPFPNPQK
jgi:SPP1 family phage portal protein